MKYKKGVIKGNEIVKQDKDITYLKYSNCDKIFSVDTSKLPIVQQITWHKGTREYAMGTDVNTKKLLKLHRVILADELNKPENEGMVVDHIDRNKDNNTLANLRIVPIRINDLNNELVINSEAQVNGVIPSYNKYLARIETGGTRYNLGTYADKYDAGLVYDSYIYHNLPETEWNSMNIKQGKIPNDVLNKYCIDPNDPSTLPKIPSSKQGNNIYNGVSVDKKYGYCSVYVKNIDRKQDFLCSNKKGISEVEGAAIREQYLLDHPELKDLNTPNAVWPEEKDGKINIAGIIVDRDTYELETRGY